MSKFVKGLMERDFKGVFEGMDECLVVSLRGIGGTDVNRMRGELLKKSISVKVVKNSLAKRAFADLGMAQIKEVLVGNSAIAYGGDSIVDVAKEMVGWGKEFDVLKIKGGFLEGVVLDADAAKALSKMPSREELQGQIVGLALTPGGNIVGAATGPAGAIAGCLKTIIEKLESSEAVAAA